MQTQTDFIDLMLGFAPCVFAIVALFVAGWIITLMFPSVVDWFDYMTEGIFGSDLEQEDEYTNYVPAPRIDTYL